MKKVYKKPVLYIEKFTVDKNFANSCGAEPGTSEFGSEFTCSWNAFFHDGVLSCELDPKDQGTEADCTMVYGILLVRLHLKYILWNKNIL